MKHKLIAGNWKMNGGLAANEALIKALLVGSADWACRVALCVPAPYLARAKWVQVGPGHALASADLGALLRRSHALVAAKLTIKLQIELGVRR